MLEIFDEHGESLLSINDNTTKIIAVYQKSIHHGRLPPPLMNGDELIRKNYRPFMVSNMLYDFSETSVHDIHTLFQSTWQNTQDLLKKDVVVMGVYYHV